LCNKVNLIILVWQIARDSLGETNTAIVDNLLHYMDEEDLVFSNDLEIACFMDDMKSMGFKAFSSWHYYDQPFCDGIDPEDIESTLTKDNNVYWILNQAMYTLGYSHVRDPFNGKFAKSLMLNYLIHFHGDIHSPLHLISRFTPSKPSGDLGGNLFKIEYNQYIKNLHSLWDQSMDKITYTTRPLSQSSVQYLEQMAEQIASEFTRDDLATDLEIKDFDEIAEHGFQLAKQYAYQGTYYFNINF
jgi:hypothetical protein